MALKKTHHPILNKSHIKALQPLIFLILLVLSSFNPLYSQGTNNNTNTIEVVVKPEVPVLGDTVQIKIKKLEGNNNPPKIFFDKTKLPVFSIPGSYYRTFIPISADYKVGKYPLEVFYKGQVKILDLIVSAKQFPLQELTLTKEVAALKASRIERALVAKAIETLSNEKLWVGKFIFPSYGNQSTVYGEKRRVNGVINPDYFHKGLDFAASFGSEVRASESGRVVLAGYGSKGFVVNGNCIFIDHGHGVITGYLHLSSILVKEGDLVKKGQIIGRVGSSGIASGPHLHWGVYVLGMTVDPTFWTSMTIE